VKVQEADYQEKYDKKLKEYAKKAFVKGFRQGKVPPMVIKKLYGKTIKVEEINQLAYESLYNYLREENLQIFGSPMIAIDKMEKIDWDNHQEFEFVYEIGLQPELSFEFGSDFSIKEYEVQLSDSDLGNYKKNLLEKFAQYEDKEEVSIETDVWGRLSPTSDEVLILSDKEFTKGKEFFGIIDIDTLSEENQNLFLGKKIGDAITFDLRTVFPTDVEMSNFLRYEKDDLIHIKGEVSYTINSISTRTMPEMNQETFDKVFGQNTVTNEEEFDVKIKEVLQKRYDIAAQLETLLSFMQTLDEKASVTLPTHFLKRWLASQNNEKQMDEVGYENFQKGLHNQIIIEQLSKQNEVSVEEDELRKYAREVQILNLFSMGFLTGITNESVLDMFVDRFFENEESEQTLMSFERNIKATKLLAVVKDKITTEKIILSGEEFDKIGK
jgi:trigger factor